jgi:hypothetical protein
LPPLPTSFQEHYDQTRVIRAGDLTTLFSRP